MTRSTRSCTSRATTRCKALITARGALKRLRQALATGSYDIVFVQREATQLGTAAFEAAVARSSAKLVFDFDDAIWFANSSDANRRFAWLKSPDKVAAIIGHSDLVLAGNRYLADYAGRFADNVRILPTTIDTAGYQREPRAGDPDRICVGWSGSVTTIQHLELALPVFRALRERFGERVYFKVIGDPRYRNDELGITGVPWTAESEVRELSEFDIGVMPLPEDEWAKGKCGLKGLQYMALEIPTIMSPVGVNSEIVDDGVNGYLATGLDEWMAKLAQLIESPERRRALGATARETVEREYSVTAQRDNYVTYLREVLDRPARA